MTGFSLVGPLSGVLFSFLGTGLPLGIPPDKEDAIMSHVAPEECILFASWTATAKPSASSANQTEQLLAEPEIRAFVAALQRNVLAAGIAAAKKNGTPPEQAEKIGNAAALWVRTLFARSGALYVSRLAPRGQGVDVQAALIIKANETAPELEQSLRDIFATAGVATSEVTLVGRKFQKVVIPADQPIDVVWSAGNGYFLVGLGPGAMEDMSARIRAQKEPAWLTQLKANLSVERRSTISYVNIKRLFDTFLPLGGPEAEKVVNAWGFRQIISFQSVTGLDKTGMISRSLLAIEGEPRGLLTLLDEKGISAGDLKHIPADSLTALAFVFDLRKVFDMATAALGEADPRAAEQSKQAIAQGQALLGINIPEALSALGSHWSLHVPTADGGPLGSALVVEVRDKNRLLNVEKTLLARLAGPAGEIPNVGRISRSTAAGQSITSLTARTPIPVVPSWCVTEKQLIVGLNPQAIKSILSRQPGEKSLAETPEVASPLVAASLVGANGPLSLTYYDTPRAFASMYSQAQVLIPVLRSMAEQASIPFELDAGQLPTQRAILQHLRPSVTMMRRTAKGLETESRQTFPGLSLSPATSGVAVALLLPAVQAAREAARRQQIANHIKQQLLALQNHHDTFSALPAAYSQSKDGKPLLSWRVAILPFLEQKQLYDQFHHDEPWDSEHNKQFIAKMPNVFRSPNSSAKPGMTNYLGVGGPHGVLGPPQLGANKGTPFSAITDGTANTIAIVEATDALAVEWTKPIDWVPDEKDPLQGLLGMRPNGFLAGFADGHTAFVTKTIDAKVLGFLFSRDDGNNVQLPENAPVAAPRPVRPPPGAAPGPPRRAPKPGPPRS